MRSTLFLLRRIGGTANITNTTHTEKLPTLSNQFHFLRERSAASEGGGAGASGGG
ncbi:MAG TPA: hypothetical protein VF258_08605 [Luteolibacter sp.]